MFRFISVLIFYLDVHVRKMKSREINEKKKIKLKKFLREKDWNRERENSNNMFFFLLNRMVYNCCSLLIAKRLIFFSSFQYRNSKVSIRLIDVAAMDFKAIFGNPNKFHTKSHSIYKKDVLIRWPLDLWMMSVLLFQLKMIWDPLFFEWDSLGREWYQFFSFSLCLLLSLSLFIIFHWNFEEE